MTNAVTLYSNRAVTHVQLYATQKTLYIHIYIYIPLQIELKEQMGFQAALQCVANNRQQSVEG